MNTYEHNTAPFDKHNTLLGGGHVCLSKVSSIAIGVPICNSSFHFKIILDHFNLDWIDHCQDVKRKNLVTADSVHVINELQSAGNIFSFLLMSFHFFPFSRTVKKPTDEKKKSSQRMKRTKGPANFSAYVESLVQPGVPGQEEKSENAGKEDATKDEVEKNQEMIERQKKFEEDEALKAEADKLQAEKEKADEAKEALAEKEKADKDDKDKEALAEKAKADEAKEALAEKAKADEAKEAQAAKEKADKDDAEAKEAAKKQKQAEKDAEKKRKLEEKEAAKKEKKEAEKKRKLEEKEAEKTRKLEEKEAAKKQKEAEKDAEKKRKLEEKEAAKKEKKDAEKKRKKADEKEAKKTDEKESEKTDEQEAEKKRKADEKEAEKKRKADEKEAEKKRKADEKEAEKKRKAAEQEDQESLKKQKADEEAEAKDGDVSAKDQQQDSDSVVFVSMSMSPTMKLPPILPDNQLGLSPSNESTATTLILGDSLEHEEEEEETTHKDGEKDEEVNEEEKNDDEKTEKNDDEKAPKYFGFCEFDFGNWSFKNFRLSTYHVASTLARISHSFVTTVHHHHHDCFVKLTLKLKRQTFRLKYSMLLQLLLENSLLEFPHVWLFWAPRQEKKKPGTYGRVGLRGVFWDHMKEAMNRIKDSNPTLPKKDVLQQARLES